MLRNSHCSAPPLQSTFRPCLSREAEAVLRPRAPLRPTKKEVRESEASSSVEFVINDAEDIKVKVEAPAEVTEDPRQLCARLAAIRVVQPTPTASSASKEVAGPSGTAFRTQALRRIPSAQLGPAEPPRGRGRPKGSKSRPRVALTFGTSALPERAEAAKARTKIAPKK